jgi:DNA-binding MarR family transcriptional regulator
MQRPPALPPISDLETHLGYWLRLLSNHVSGRFRERVEAAGASVSEWVALRRLYPAGHATPAELVAALGMSKGAISKIVDRLHSKGWAVREGAGADRRHQRVVLTEAGRALVVQLAAIADENDAHFFGHLSAAGRAELIHAAQSLAQHHRLLQVPVD